MGKVAIVTGGARGMGAAYVRKLASMGYDVAFNDVRDDEETLALVDAIKGDCESKGVRCHFGLCDVSSWDDASRFVAEVVDSLGTDVDVLVNNAGIVRGGNLVDVSMEEFEQVVRVDLMGSINMAKAVAPHMIARHAGCIVNIGSTATLSPMPGLTSYAVAKTGLIGLTKSLAAELGEHGVRVNMVCSGPTLTEMTLKYNTPEQLEELRMRLPLHELITPEDQADFVSFVIRSTKMTGQVLANNCGEAMVC